MLSSAHLLAALALLSTAALVASCLADAPDDDGVALDELKAKPVPVPTQEAYDPIPEGPCKVACQGVPLGRCGRWQDECASDWPEDLNVVCGTQYLTCNAAKHAMENNLSAQMWCYRDCMQLH